MDITAISDLHGYYPKLPGGDLLIVAGDLTCTDKEPEYFNLFQKLSYEKYQKIIIIAGNHDNCLEKNDFTISWSIDSQEIFEYLCDSGTEFEGLKIWGTPWTKTFVGMNPQCKTFTCDTEEELAKHWEKIPEDTDILITHSPPWGIRDKTYSGENVGSKSLALKVGNMESPPKLWVWGHIHEAYGEDLAIRSKSCKMINASHVNEYYKPVNKPVRIKL